jgi:hypothetical protein
MFAGEHTRSIDKSINAISLDVRRGATAGALGAPRTHAPDEKGKPCTKKEAGAQQCHL